MTTGEAAITWHEPAVPFRDACAYCGTAAPLADLQPARVTLRGWFSLGGIPCPLVMVNELIPAEWWRCRFEYDCLRRQRMRMGPAPAAVPRAGVSL